MPVLLTPQFIGITPLTAHIRRAVEFVERTDVYVAMAKTSPWTDDNAPPDPDPLTVDVTEPVAYKKPTKQTLLVPDATGPIEIYGVTWREVDTADAYTEKARHVWLQGEFVRDEVPTNISYRMIGVYSELQREPVDLAANPGRTLLLPVHVQDPGVLEYLYHDKPIPRRTNRRDQINIVIAF